MIIKYIQKKNVPKEEKRIIKPWYLSPRTYRTYDEYIRYAQYAAGWNDAMKYIFGEDKS